MSDQLNQEDRAIQRALARLGTSTPLESSDQTRVLKPRPMSDRAVSVPFADGASDDTLLREYLELLALMPYELEPVTPASRVKDHLLAETATSAARVVQLPRRDVGDLTLVGDRAKPLDSAGDLTLLREPERPSAPQTPLPAAAAASSPVAAPAPSPATASSSWFLPATVAATLAFCLLGLGFLAGKVNEQNTTIARLSTDLQLASGIANSLASRQNELTKVENRFNMITSVARQAYPMRPLAVRSSDKADAWGSPLGTVWVCGRHQQWYLNLQGLETPPAGLEYHLWFVTKKGTLHGGVLDVVEHTAELEAPGMPVGTQGFAVTLETIGPHSEPEGEFVLLGDAPVRL